MRSALLFATAFAFASALDLDPDLDIDWDLVLNLDPLPSPNIPVVYKTAKTAIPATSTRVIYAATSAAAAAAEAVVDTLEHVLSDPIILIPGFHHHKRNEKRSPAATCVPQPLGSGPVPVKDEPAEFLKDRRLSAAATRAEIPVGYVNTFTNLQASNNAYGYMGYTLLPSYNTTLCATTCTAIAGCQSFNLYFERNPSVDPNSPTCLNPPSTTNIKCVFWGGPATADNAVNTGQWRGKFHVVIAGSNGYVNRTTATPPGYSMPQFLGNVAINAPQPCPGRPSRLLQSNAFVAQTFDIRLCATACSEQKAWARTQPNMRQCNFFDTYLLYKNSKPLAQYCAMYDEMWAPEFATNTGYMNGNDRFTLGFSYTSWNVTDLIRGSNACPSVVTTTTTVRMTTSASTTTTATTTMAVPTTTVATTTSTEEPTSTTDDDDDEPTES
ncbi:hypothetical protein B9Z65_6761 [Elsinoe australis]|uniref:Uncharacterized protein n=1 Tax=Elsinoe australis TaxID=40998 RepID=A0A2P8AE53_9PEZI|nr:hypothetical protein B9Z65_6761 [Elsinoe australis]